MKKSQMFFLFVSVIACMVTIISSLHAAEIIYLEGSVQVQGEQEEGWRNAELGTKVDVGDKIRTARKSIADVALDEAKKNTIRISPKTLVILDSANPGTIDRLDLSRGMVYAKVENIQSGLSFEVSTPSAVAGVRGSAYSVYVERDEDEIKAYKDSAFVQAYDADGNLITEVTVPEGFKTFVERFEGPGSLIQVTLREFSRFDDVADEIASHEEGNMEVRREQERAAQQEAQSSEEKLDEGQAAQDVTDTLSDLKDQTQENTQDDDIDDFRGGHEEEMGPY